MKQIFIKQYDGEAISDFHRDMSEAVLESYNPAMKGIPDIPGMPGFMSGTFVVDIKWFPAIDWENAPKAATHWGPQSHAPHGSNWIETFYMFANGAWFVWLNSNGTWGDPTIHSDWPERVKQLIPRP